MNESRDDPGDGPFEGGGSGKARAGGRGRSQTWGRPDRSKVVSSLWLVAGAMAIHEAEEWNIAAWAARNFANHTGISDPAIRIGLVVITALFLFWIFVATRLRSPLAISLVALPAVALVAVGNAVQHVAWTVLFGEYAPGVASAVLLVVPASLYSLVCMVRVERRLLVPVAICATLWVIAAAQIVAAGRSMQPFQLALHRLCIAAATALGLPGIEEVP